MILLHTLEYFYPLYFGLLSLMDKTPASTNGQGRYFPGANVIKTEPFPGVVFPTRVQGCEPNTIKTPVTLDIDHDISSSAQYMTNWSDSLKEVIIFGNTLIVAGKYKGKIIERKTFSITQTTIDIQRQSTLVWYNVEKQEYPSKIFYFKTVGGEVFYFIGGYMVTKGWRDWVSTMPVNSAYASARVSSVVTKIDNAPLPLIKMNATVGERCIFTSFGNFARERKEVHYVDKKVTVGFSPKYDGLEIPTTNNYYFGRAKRSLRRRNHREKRSIFQSDDFDVSSYRFNVVVTRAVDNLYFGLILLTEHVGVVVNTLGFYSNVNNNILRTNAINEKMHRQVQGNYLQASIEFLRKRDTCEIINFDFEEQSTLEVRVETILRDLTRLNSNLRLSKELNVKELKLELENMRKSLGDEKTISWVTIGIIVLVIIGLFVLICVLKSCIK